MGLGPYSSKATQQIRSVSNQKVAGRSCNIHVNTAPLGLPCQVGCYCSLQGSQPVKPADCFSSLALHVELVGTSKVIQQRWSFQTEYRLDFSMSYDSSMQHLQQQGLYHQVLELWQYPVMFREESGWDPSGQQLRRRSPMLSYIHIHTEGLSGS